MSDIVKELLSRASDQDGIGWTPTTVIPVPARLLHHAADRIEWLEAEAKTRTLEYLGQVGQLSEELERLRAALREIVAMDEVAIVDFKKGDGWLHQRVARAALEERT